jgi:hypothetical protein
MSTDLSHEPDRPASPVTALPGIIAEPGHTVPGAVSAAGNASLEGRYLAGPGKPVYRHMSDLQAREADAAVKVEQCQGAVLRAAGAEKERTENHRGGDRPWLLRLIVPPAALAEAFTAYVAMEALVDSQLLAVGLAALAALIGVGMACLFANRRLNRLPVPAAARSQEVIFVAVLTVLRYESLRIQGAGFLTSAGGAALAALISGLVLLGIEEVVVETRTFAIFVSTLRVSWQRWRYAAAVKDLAVIQARIKAAAGKLQQQFLGFLLKIEGLPLGQARQCAAALRAALADGEA